MKFTLVYVFFLYLVQAAFGESIKSQIHSLHSNEKMNAHLVFLEDGRVAFLRGEGLKLLEPLREAMKKEEMVELVLDKDHNLLSVQSTAPSLLPNTSEEEIAPMSYQASVITSSTASNVFYRMRMNYQDESQCYNRAHIWTYEEYRRSNLLSNKLFLFFTTRYIWAYNYKWWFHVTPMAYVGGSSSAYWRTLDRRYTSGPLTTRTWTNVFMYNDANCPIVSRWTDYYNHQSTQYCYLIPTSMYYWQPRDIKAFEETGLEKTQYISSEVNYAYWEAF